MNSTKYSREEIIAGNPLLDYAQKQGWQLKRSGPNFICLCPLHDETTPSFTLHPEKNLWKCFGCGAGGSVIDLHSRLQGVTTGEAMRELSGAGIADGSSFTTNGYRAPHGSEAEQRARLRANWPTLDQPTKDEIKVIAELRRLSPEGVALAAARGLLFCAESREGRCWVVTDSRRVNAQARRVDGNLWERIGGKKAWTLPGSQANWPVGLREAANFPAIAVVEGGPDMLAAFHLAWLQNSIPETLEAGKGVDLLSRLGVVAILGAGIIRIHESALRFFQGKRIRIFQHDDNSGRKVSEFWAAQLSGAGANVDGYAFDGFMRFDGEHVNDLNDFVCIDPDQWEAHRDLIESAFDFVPLHPGNGQTETVETLR